MSFFYSLVKKILLYGWPFLLLVVLMMVVGFVRNAGVPVPEVFMLQPHSGSHLIGIITTPFIHKDMNHLLSNALPFITLGILLKYAFKHYWWVILCLAWLFTGLWTWMAARETYHIGASGIVYALFGFLITVGFIGRNRVMIIIALLAVFEYGSMVWGIFPVWREISWESHGWGFLSGMLLAFVFRKEGLPAEVWQWEEEEQEEEENMQEDHFDYDGNTTLKRF